MFTIELPAARKPGSVTVTCQTEPAACAYSGSAPLTSTYIVLPAPHPKLAAQLVIELRSLGQLPAGVAAIISGHTTATSPQTPGAQPHSLPGTVVTCVRTASSGAADTKSTNTSADGEFSIELPAPEAPGNVTINLPDRAGRR